MAESYKTIKEISEGCFKEKGSKFLAFAFPVSSEEEATKYRQDLRKKYFDARHHVYAFHIGIENIFYRSSDDGEPTNSSGPSVLGQIKSFGLTNILIVVIRYFGGTKLGIPGLINAYKSAAKDAIDKAVIVEKKIELKLKLKFNYESVNDVMRIMKTEGISIINQKFDMLCYVELNVQKKMSDSIIQKLKKIPGMEIS